MSGHGAAQFPLPDLSFEPTRRFWEAAAAGELRIPRCDGCGAWSWYPRTPCARCNGGALSWTALSGHATLFAWAVVRHAFLEPFREKVPFVTGLVCIEEEPSVRVVTEIVDCDPRHLVAGMALRAVFRPMSFPGVEGEVIAPYFAPVAGEPGNGAGGDTPSETN